MITNVDITILNKRYDAESRSESYVPTVLNGVSYLEGNAASVSSVWSDQSTYKIRIPKGATEKTYLDAKAYKSAADVSGNWTIEKADYILLGVHDISGTQTELTAYAKENDLRLIAVTEYSDNTIRGCEYTKHWRVGGK